MEKETKRYIWIDQARGIGILSVIYGHNFPLLEHYIYSYHIPLFFFIAGLFHPRYFTLKSIKHRAKKILTPYFVWSFLLFLFWLFLGRHYGESAHKNLNVGSNLIGVFYGQIDAHMDWGIPMWFLPCIFITYVLFGLLLKIKNKALIVIVGLFFISLGILYPNIFNFKLPWSIDVACVSLLFYGAAFFLRDYIFNFKTNRYNYAFLALFLLVSIIFGLSNSKIDMYRSSYGDPTKFILSAYSGIAFIILLVKQFNISNFFSYLGKNTIVLLALHTRALTLIKLALLIFGLTVFQFNELTKIVLTFVQILLLIPAIFIVNTYIPILNGKQKVVK